MTPAHIVFDTGYGMGMVLVSEVAGIGANEANLGLIYLKGGSVMKTAESSTNLLNSYTSAFLNQKQG